MFRPGDFVKVKEGYNVHNAREIGMICDEKKEGCTVVFNLIPDKKTGKGHVWFYPEKYLEIVDLKDEEN